MTRLEQLGRRYHLVGHSHGGSVIWHALRAASLKRVNLERLRSWTTVGTPFLHHRTHSLSSVATWLNLLLAVVLFKPAFVVMYRLVTILSFDAVPQAPLAQVAEAHRPTLYTTPILYILQLFGEPLQITSMVFASAALIPLEATRCFSSCSSAWKGGCWHSPDWSSSCISI